MNTDEPTGEFPPIVAVVCSCCGEAAENSDPVWLKASHWLITESIIACPGCVKYANESVGLL